MKIEHLIRQARQHYYSTKKMQLCQLELAKKKFTDICFTFDAICKSRNKLKF